jgi:hypothetical protein
MIPILTIESQREKVEGFHYLWLKYVTGFDPSQHCARCLIGKYSRKVTRGMPADKPLVLDEARQIGLSGRSYDYLYLCGVASRGGWKANFHLAFLPDPDATIMMPMSTGDTVIVQHARSVPIIAVPEGFDGRDKVFTTCRNWQFGVSAYGLPSRPL